MDANWGRSFNNPVEITAPSLYSVPFTATFFGLKARGYVNYRVTMKENKNRGKSKLSVRGSHHINAFG